MDATALITIIVLIGFIIGGLFLARMGDRQSRETYKQNKSEHPHSNELKDKVGHK